MLADEKARFDDLHYYNGQDIIVTLPTPMTVYDVNYLAVYNDQTRDTLGYISFDVTQEMVPPALGQTKKPGWWFDVPTLPPPSVPKNQWKKKKKPGLDSLDGSGTGTEVGLGGSGRGNPGLSREPVFNHSLQLPNCKELLGRKIRLLWRRESDTMEVYFRLKVHMSESEQFAAIGIAVQNSPDIEADIVKVFFNETSQQFQTQDAFQVWPQTLFLFHFNIKSMELPGGQINDP